MARAAGSTCCKPPGTAYYRAGQWDEAIRCIEKSSALHGGLCTCGWSVLAAGNPAAGFKIQNVYFNFRVQVSPGIQAGIEDVITVALEIDVTFAFNETLVDTANNDSTTIPLTDFGKISLKPTGSLSADVALEVDIVNNNCLFKLTLGSITWDINTGAVTTSGLSTGCCVGGVFV